MKIFKVVLFVWAYPLTFLWMVVYRVRRFCYNYGFFKCKKFSVPIISVGNITFGGTGKTPFTAWITNYLNSIDKKVMIVTRGHKGELENSRGIIHSDDIKYNPKEYGDEPLMLSYYIQNGSVVVGKNKGANLEYYYDREQSDVVILDDGYQHLKVKRDLNIVLFDSSMPLERYKTPPLGYLREGFSSLNDADLIILGRVDLAGKDKVNALKTQIECYVDSPVFVEFSYRSQGIFNCKNDKVFELFDLKGKSVLAVAGVASPISFYEQLKDFGAHVIERTFPDHHYYSTTEMAEILNEAKASDSYIITTEKDIVKMKRYVGSEKIFFLKIEINLLLGEEILKERINEVLY